MANCRKPACDIALWLGGNVGADASLPRTFSRIGIRCNNPRRWLLVAPLHDPARLRPSLLRTPCPYERSARAILGDHHAHTVRLLACHARSPPCGAWQARRPRRRRHPDAHCCRVPRSSQMEAVSVPSLPFSFPHVRNRRATSLRSLLQSTAKWMSIQATPACKRRFH